MTIRQLILSVCLMIAIPVASQKTEKEVKMGDASERQLEQQIGFYQHSSNAFLDKIGNRLVSNLEEQRHNYHFGIIDMPEANALALPNGHIYFSRGILTLANSEQELAGVMGHEIIHVNQSHSRKSNNKSIFTGILKVPGALVGMFSPVAGGILMAPFSLFDAGYSRKHESQSDELGAQLAAKSGYNPEGLLSILEKMSAEQELKSGSEESRSFYNTHPNTPKRINDLEKVIRKLNYEETSQSDLVHEVFLKKMEGMTIGENPAKGTFINSKYIHPELRFSFSYPKDWKGVNLSTVVGFISPDSKAQMVLSLKDETKNVGDLARAYTENHYKKYGTKPDRDESIQINGHPAHLVSYKGESDGEALIFSVLWLTRDKRTYMMAIMSIEAYEMALLKMAKSLHLMTAEEKNQIRKTVLHIVRANKGETLESLSKRTGNVLELDYVALINDLDGSKEFTKNQWVKIGLLKKY